MLAMSLHRKNREDGAELSERANVPREIQGDPVSGQTFSHPRTQMTAPHLQPQEHCSETLLPPHATSAAVELTRSEHSFTETPIPYIQQGSPGLSYGNILSPEFLMILSWRHPLLSLTILTYILCLSDEKTRETEDAPVY